MQENDTRMLLMEKVTVLRRRPKGAWCHATRGNCVRQEQETKAEAGWQEWDPFTSMRLTHPRSELVVGWVYMCITMSAYRPCANPAEDSDERRRRLYEEVNRHYGGNLCGAIGAFWRAWAVKKEGFLIIIIIRGGRYS